MLSWLAGHMEVQERKINNCRIPTRRINIIRGKTTKLINPFHEDMESPCFVWEEAATAIKSNHPSCGMDNGDHHAWKKTAANWTSCLCFLGLAVGSKI